MTGQLIFKMELFKFLKDKSFILTAIILGGINTALTLLLLNIDSYSSFSGEGLGVTIGFMAFFTFIANIIFAWLYPFRMISMDYKNNVMAMMVASGVNRKKLYFAKIGAIFVSTIAMMLLITGLPAILILLKLAQTGFWEYFVQGFSEAFSVLDFSGFQFFLYLFVGYLSSLSMIAAACIVMKGKGISFLVFIGFSFATNIVTGILNTIAPTYDFSSGFAFFYQLLILFATIAVFGFISLKTLEKQSL